MVRTAPAKEPSRAGTTEPTAALPAQTDRTEQAVQPAPEKPTAPPEEVLKMCIRDRLYDEDTSEFYYVDYRDFKPVAFGEPEPIQSQVLQLYRWKSGSERLPFIMRGGLIYESRI